MTRLTLGLMVLSSGCSLLVPGNDGLTPDLVDGGQVDRDAGRDAGRDTGVEPGTDAGPACESGLTGCGGDCVDTQSDLAHCGGCDSACAATDVCREGACFDPVVEVAAAWYHTCARRASGRVFCWGDNTNGQLGDGSVLSSAVPVEVAGIDDAISIATGSALPGSGFPGTSCAVRRSGELWCWGSNHRGQLNDGTMDTQRSPVVTAGIDAAVTVSNNFWGACVTRPSAPYVVCWDASAAPPVPEDVLGFSSGRVQQLVQGAGHACALEDSGRVACWGNNAAGQLGDGTTDPHAAGRTVMEDGRAIAAGLVSSCAVHTTGEVSCWGRSGDLVDGTTVLTPTIVPGLDDVVAIGSGPVAVATCAVRSDGTIACWGLDLAEYARTGTEIYDPAPATIEGLTDVVSVSVGIRYACAAKRDGTVWCWGGNGSGQLGDGTMEDRAAPTPVLLP